LEETLTEAQQIRSDTATEFTRSLDDLRAGGGDVPMRDIFALAKEFSGMEPTEIEALLEADDHLLRVGAVSIMDFQARARSTSASRRRDLYELYIRRHDRIDTWDLVDRAAPYVVGGYLSDKPRDPLYVLARSADWWERRTAIVATYFFIRQDDLDDTYAIADILADDPEELVQKAVGGWVREAGKRDPGRLLAFLDRHARTMPRTALRYAIEHLDPETRRHYLELR
jgi:3-methyladenine DNA glycosylase AlkD